VCADTRVFRNSVTIAHGEDPTLEEGNHYFRTEGAEMGEAATLKQHAH
jgi:hypothetical protein